MSRCVRCAKSGFLVRVDGFGLCRPCRDLVERDAERRLKAFFEIEGLVEHGASVDARLRACDTALEHARVLSELASQGAALGEFEPESATKRLGTRREQMLLDALADAVAGAKGRAAAARSPQARRGALERGLERVETIASQLKRKDQARKFERELMDEIKRLS